MTAPLNAVLIDLGMGADMHAAAIAATGGLVRLHAVHARRSVQATAFAQRQGGIQVHKTLDDIRDDAAIDFAILVTPPKGRAAYVTALAQRGLDLMLHLFGRVDAVQAMTATTPLHSLEAEDLAAAALSFRSGAVGSVMASVTHYPGAEEEIVINATLGSARPAGDRLQLAFQDGRRDAQGSAAGAGTGGGADPMAFSHAWHQAVIEDFAHAIAAGRPPAITGQSALGVHAPIDAITRSAETGRRETVKDTDA